MAERFTSALQENCLTLLCHSDEQGGLVANLVEAKLFEGEYRTIAERAIDYWHDHKEAPKLHTADLVAEFLEDSKDPRSRTYRRILLSMVELSESINATYVLQKLRTFVRMQNLKLAIMRSAEQLDAMQEGGIEEVEHIWSQLLRTSEVTFDPGIRLTDYQQLINYLERHESEFTTGIRVLDKHGIVPMRGRVFLFLAPTGIGKTWLLINLGKEAFKLRKKILHISLEMPSEEVMMRYYQSIFATAKRDEKSKILTMRFDKLDKLSGFGSQTIRPEFALNSPHASEELEARVDLDQARLNNLVIKSFPSASLTMNTLRAYLDNLETVERFIPDLILLDYIGEIKTDPRFHRVELGRAFKEFRGICSERNIAGATAHQISRKGAGAHQARSTHVAEDWSLIGTADIAITMSRTESEAKYGLARLYVDKARSDRDKFGVLITQNYTTGQFVLESTLLSARYERLMEKMTRVEEQPSDSDEDDEEE